MGLNAKDRGLEIGTRFYYMDIEFEVLEFKSEWILYAKNVDITTTVPEFVEVNINQIQLL